MVRKRRNKKSGRVNKVAIYIVDARIVDIGITEYNNNQYDRYYWQIKVL